MNVKRLSVLHFDLLNGFCIEDLDTEDLLQWGNSLLTQFRQAKSIIRNLSTEDSPAELAHWEDIKNFTYGEIDAVVEELYSRSIIDLENFGAKLSIKLANYVAKVRASAWLELSADRNKKVAETEDETVELIFDT